MPKFYFLYDRDNKKAKVVLDPDTEHTQILLADKLVCDVPVESKIKGVSPLFAMYGECKVVRHSPKKITLTNKR